MELHSHVVTAKKLWNYLRVAFFMMRKGFASKRRLLMDMNLMMKRGKLLRKSLGSLLLVFHHHHPRPEIPSFGLREYEFSCSNSPNPVFYHAAASKRRHNYFPCLHAVVEDDDDNAPARPAVVQLQRIEYSPSPSPQCGSFEFVGSSLDLAPGERRTPLMSTSASPFSIRVLSYSSEEEEEEEEEEDGLSQEVDDEAEEFIKRFYAQLRAQSRIALLEYQEREYQEMLARGV